MAAANGKGHRANGGPENIDQSQRSIHSQSSPKQQESYQARYSILRADDDAIRPLEERDGSDDAAKEHYRECKEWEKRVCDDHGLTAAHSRVLIRIFLHLNH